MARVNGKRRLNLDKYLTHMKETMTKIKRVGMVNLVGPVAINSRVITKKMGGTVMEKCSGLMAQSTKELGKEAFKMVSD
jgi:hypothetical protein